MAHVFRTHSRKDGKAHPRWRFEFIDWQGRKRKGTGYTSKAETEKLALRVQAEHDEIRKGFRPPPKRSERPRAFDEASAEYLAWGEAQGGRGGRAWSERHARMRRVHLAWWKDELRLKMVFDLHGRLADVERALRGLKDAGKAGKTLANHAESLSAFCDWCVERDYLREDPLKGLSPFDTTPLTRRRAMTYEEIRLLLDRCVPWRRLVYEVAFCTGLRANELAQLTVVHLDARNRALRLDATWTKNRKEGSQPLPAELVEKLESESVGKRPADPLLRVPSHPARDFDKDLKRAGVEKVTDEGKLDFHACRVAYTTFVVEAGATVKEAQTLLRHSTPQITMDIYARARNGRLSEVAEMVAKRILGDPTPTSPQRPSKEADDDDVSDEDEPACVAAVPGVRFPPPPP